MDITLNNLPSPDKLAKQSRLGTKQVSIRVKDRTYDVFSRYANLYETTPGGIINSLLDTYAENVYKNEQMSTLDKAGLKSYMFSALNKLAKMSDEDLFLVAAHRVEFEDEEDSIRNLYRGVLYRLENNQENPPYQLLHFENLRHMYLAKDGKARLEKDGPSSKFYTLYIPLKHWFYVSAFLALYARKYVEYNRDYEASPVLEENFLEQLVVSANSAKTKSELANKLNQLFE